MIVEILPPVSLTDTEVPMLALPLLLALTLTPPVGQSSCSELSPTSTLADQFVCYKDAGRKVMLPGTSFISGFNGPACIVGVGADRIQVAKCGNSSFGREVMMVPFTSIQAVEDDASKPYVTIRLVVAYIRNDCVNTDCIIDRPAPRPAPARRPTPVAMPPRP